MAPSFLKAVGAATIALAARAGAAKSYQISETYDGTSFFEKFDFFTDVDPNGGYVQYQSRSDSEKLGLIRAQDGEIYIGVDYAGEYDPLGFGRKSVRLESKNVYNHGLVVADFIHLPKPVCGSWPAFWFFGEPWPTKGEIDIYENWNDLTFNRHTAHVDAPDVVGDCIITQDGMTANIDSPNCYDHAPDQWAFQGCSASEYSSTFGSPSGGVYAMEWTDDFLKIWDWPRTAAPADVLSGKPVPSDLWGVPSYVIQQCDVSKAFRDMKMILNVDFCAVAGQADKWDESCKAKTGYDTCTQYVAKEHGDFAEVNFKIKDIKIYQLVETALPTSSSSTSSSTSTVSTSSVISTSSSTSATPTSSTVSATSIASSTSSQVGVSSSSSSAVTPSSSNVSVTSSSTIPDSSISASETTKSTTPSSSASSTTFDDDDTCTDDGDHSSSSYVASSTGSVSATVTSSFGTATSVPSSPYPVLTSSSSEESELTTSTIYSTAVRTVTSCPATVTNCPTGGYVTTEIISVGTTVCPVTSTSSQPRPTTTASVPEGYTTGTVKVTKTYTITSCKPTVTDCPVGSVTTEIIVKTATYPAEKPNTVPSSAVSQTAESTVAVSKPTTEAVKPPSTTATTDVVTKPSKASSSSDAEVNAITTTVVPAASANTGYYHPNATLATSVALSLPSGSPGVIGGGIVVVSSGIRVTVNLALLGVLAIFFTV